MAGLGPKMPVLCMLKCTVHEGIHCNGTVSSKFCMVVDWGGRGGGGEEAGHVQNVSLQKFSTA